jgi:pimeloyl-ACP methyl ester carboxylesterase
MSRVSSRPFWRRGASVAAAAAIVTAALIPMQAASGDAPTVAQETDAAKPTIVMVHGLWADSSSFAPVTSILQSKGYKVQVVANPLRGVTSDSAYLASYIQQATTGPVVVVAHSYGGVVATNAAASDPDVRGLVYIDAFAPAEGQTLGGIVAESTSVLNVTDPTTVFDVVAYAGAENGDVDLYLKPEVFHKSFMPDVDPVTRSIMLAGQRPTANFVNYEPSGVPAWATLPSWYVLGTQDQIVPPALQREQAEQAGSTIVEVEAGHVPMLSKPLQVAKVIEKAEKSFQK